MKTKTITLIETDLRTGKSSPVKIEIINQVHGGYLTAEEIEQKKQGDIHTVNGLIRYVWVKLPACLFYTSNRTAARTSLSYS